MAAAGNATVMIDTSRHTVSIHALLHVQLHGYMLL